MSPYCTALFKLPGYKEEIFINKSHTIATLKLLEKHKEHVKSTAYRQEWIKSVCCQDQRTSHITAANMENPTYPPFTDELTLSLDSTLTFPYQNANTFADFPQTDILSPSFLNSSLVNQNIYTNQPLDDGTINPFDLPKNGGNEDLNQFFTDSVFGTASPGFSHLRNMNNGNAEFTQAWSRSVMSATPEWVAGNDGNTGLQIVTKDMNHDSSKEEQRETIIKNGQVTPGDSPSSPKSAKGTRKSTRKPKPNSKTAQAEEAPSAEPATAPPAPVKRTRKPRKSSKKPPTPEQEAARRETFLKRNREAAYKCRIKKKTQTEMIIEKAKQLDADNVIKGMEVDKLRQEVETLRSMLLPHWRECGDEEVRGYVDGLVREGWGLGFRTSVSVGMSGHGSARASVAHSVAGENPPVKPEMEGTNSEMLLAGSDDHNSHVETARDTNANAPSPSKSHARDEDGDSALPLAKRRRSEAVFEMSISGFEESMAAAAASVGDRRMSFFADQELGGLGFGKVVDSSEGSSKSSTPVLRADGGAGWKGVMGGVMDDTPPPLDLSAPDGAF